MRLIYWISFITASFVLSIFVEEPYSPPQSPVIVHREVEIVKTVTKVLRKAFGVPTQPQRERVRATTSDMEAFVVKFWDLAQSEYDKFGVHPLLYLARGGRESAWGTSTLYKKTLNVFCIKSTKSLQAYHKVFEGGTVQHWDDDPDDRFVKFESNWMAFRAFSVFVTRDNYTKRLPKKKLKQCTLTEWSKALCKGGYSTTCHWTHDVETGRAILQIAKKYNLNTKNIPPI